LAHQADLGVAFDGDGDRALMVNHRGDVLDGDELLYIIARHRLERGKECPGVVGTLMSNFGLERALLSLGIPLVRAKVGDRYVIEAMKEQRWSLGGENSGHIICGDLTSTGDGIVAVLQVLRAVVESDRTLAEWGDAMQKLPQVMINVRLQEKLQLEHYPQIQSAVADAEAQLAGAGRVLLRPSGTEPVIRVMVEGEDQTLVRLLAERIAGVVEGVLQQ